MKTFIRDLESGKLQQGTTFSYLVKSHLATVRRSGDDQYVFLVFRRDTDVLYVLTKNKATVGAWLTQSEAGKEAFFFMNWEIFREYATAPVEAIYEG